jgi:hypothetical protein
MVRRFFGLENDEKGWVRYLGGWGLKADSACYASRVIIMCICHAHLAAAA